jgi:DNA-binding NarL/FixJ family response regulator
MSDICQRRQGSSARLPIANHASSLRSGAPLRSNRRQNGRLALIDECPLRRDCTIHLLRQSKFKTTEPFSNASELLASVSVRENFPSLVIICTGMRSVNDGAVRSELRHLATNLTSTPLILMSDRENFEDMVAAFREGVRGYIPTTLEPCLVVEAIRMVLADMPFIPIESLMRFRRNAYNLNQQCLEPTEIDARQNWPPRQLAVLRLLVQGRPNKEIARALELDESTIKVHVRFIMRKLGVTNRTQVALRVSQSRTLDSDPVLTDSCTVIPPILTRCWTGLATLAPLAQSVFVPAG